MTYAPPNFQGPFRTYLIVCPRDKSPYAPATPITVKRQAATAARTVAGLEKWVSRRLGGEGLVSFILHITLRFRGLVENK